MGRESTASGPVFARSCIKLWGDPWRRGCGTLRLMKTYNIEIQKFKSANQGNGLVTARIDALVIPIKPSDEGTETSWLSMSVDNARVLQQLLKQQLTEIDRQQPRSRRS